MLYVDIGGVIIRILVITGYKATELGIFSDKHEAIPYIKKALKMKLEPLVEEGVEWVLISGQLGVEMWAAEVVFDLQPEYPSLHLGVFTPFLDQEEKWNEANKLVYEEVLMNADYVDSITKRPYDSPQQFRLKNQFLVDKSEGLLVVYDEEKDGSPKYILQTAKNKASEEEYSISMITFSDIQSIMEEEQWNASVE